jgi:hypothetical protein
MRYLCLIYNDERLVEALSLQEFRTMGSECLAYEEELRKRGELAATESLQPVRTATSIRVQAGRTKVFDGPLVQGHEQLTGFYLIEASDLDHAIRLASRIPPARLGGVEVRPVRSAHDV